MAEIEELNVSCLLEGGHPFVTPAAELSFKAADDGEF
ncbi:hypothetical protein WH7805_11933 [Synechococcus sp. WH 7805]|nr:hypothetical protein WH7805_11933 [Synechococcus sp. WH 7805]